VADGAYLLSLDLLSEQDARELLERRLGAGRISAETEAVSGVIRLCGYLPLSLSIAAARAAARPAQLLAAQAARLRNAQTRLDGLSTGDVTTDLRAVFSWSYEQVSVTAAQLFRLIGIHPVQISPLLPPPAWPGSRSVRRVRRSPSWTRLTC
jgi:hypothetical protein